MSALLRLQICPPARARGLLAVLICGAISHASADDLAWRETGTLAAAEAHQAAAADERFLYAVANRAIAKYDRRSGERLAVSAGDAHHLNSAFLWEGKLYSAHSNYPQQPEQSQIKALDLASMELTTFRDFGAFAGSLTWVVRHADAWWCNFARYGADNAQTTLIRFDNDWKETGRWTYPADVLSELGDRSVSGGVWRGDTLCVTDHDDPLLYRLRLPKSGNVLEYVDRLATPFPGQGIAEDPLTGGLVGIDRRARRIVLARLTEPILETAADEPRRLRVLTYNIHHGEGVDARLDLERIAKVISEVAPDLVALQEVDQQTRRTQQVDQPAELARLTGMHAAFGGNIDHQGGRYGNGVLSRLPFVEESNRLLPSLAQGEQRGVLDVVCRLPGDRGLIRLLATHLDARRPDDERMASAEMISKLLADQPEMPTLLAGDLNAVPESRVLKRFLEAWTNATQQPLPTVSAQKPFRQIDFVLYAPQTRWRVASARVLDEPVASDHRPLLTVLELLPAGKETPSSVSNSQ